MGPRTSIPECIMRLSLILLVQCNVESEKGTLSSCESEKGTLSSCIGKLFWGGFLNVNLTVFTLLKHCLYSIVSQAPEDMGDRERS